MSELSYSSSSNRIPPPTKAMEPVADLLQATSRLNDISGLESVQELGQQQPELLRQSLFSGRAPAWYWNVSNGRLLVNECFENELAKGVSSLQAFFQLFSQSSGERFLTNVGGAVRDQLPFNCELELAESKTTSIMLWGLPLKVEGEQSFVGLVYPSTSRHQVLTDTRTDVLFERMFHFTNQPTCIADAEGNLLRFNPAFEQMMGIDYDGRQRLDHDFLQANHGVLFEFIDQCGQAFKDGRQAEFATQFELDWVTPKRELNLNVQVLPVKDKRGRVVRMFIQCMDQSWLMKVESNLKNQDHLLSSIVDNARSQISVKSLSGEYLLANREFYEQLPIAQIDVLGKRDEDLFPAEYAERMVRADAEVLQLNRSIAGQETFPNAKGEDRVFWTVRFPICLDGSEASAIGRVATDITPHIDIEDELQQQHQELQLLLDSIQSVIWYLDRWGQIKQGNRKAYEWLTLAEAKGKSFMEVAPNWHEVDQSQRDIMSVIRSGMPSQNKLESCSVDGDVNWYRVDRIPTKDTKGEVTGLLLMLTDVTETKRREQALAESEARYKAFIVNSSEAMFRLDFKEPIDIRLNYTQQAENIRAQGFIAECNHVMSRTLGFRSSDDVLGQTLQMLDEMAHYSPNIKDAIGEFIAGGYRLIESEFQFVSKGRATLYYQRSAMGIIENGYLTRIWGTLSDVTERKLYLENLEYQANHDSLTLLPNRNMLYKRLDEAIQNLRNDQALALMLIDLDRFKEINDTLGHQAGDSLLKQIGPRLGSEMEEYGATVARLGGDEFAVLMPRLRNVQQAVVAGHRVLDAIREPFELEGLHTEISASIGISVCPVQADDISKLMRFADVAMYHAKSEKLGVSVYNTSYDPYSTKRLRLLSDFGRAIREDELELYFQPKINIATKKAYGFEALLRWQHPTIGFIPPGEFIPLVEVTELIQPMTYWVLEQSIKQAKAWSDAGYHLSVAANLSAQNLLDEGFAKKVKALLERYQLEPELLELEITESTIMANPERAQHALAEVNALGVQMAIDDFGTGYSSLAYLKRLPVQVLKIDYSFVKSMMVDQQDEIIVNSTINLAHNLGLKVVAEGVEEEALLSRLQAMGCEMAQGYYIAQPMPVADAQRWLDESSWV